MVRTQYRDSLTNLAFLPKRDNIVKKDLALNQINNAWLKAQVTEFEYVAESDFGKFSDISNFDDLIKLRREKFLHIFSKMRKTSLAN